MWLENIKYDNVVNINENILLNSEISIYKQRILSCLQNVNTWWIEILTRVGKKKESPEKYFSLVWEKSKIQFDYIVFNEIFKLYNAWKLNYELIHINISPSTLTQFNFISNFEKIFFQYWFSDFSKISFEILENWIIKGIDILNENIDYLRSKWIQVWLDDYPNENNNNELLVLLNNIDFVKIDKKFILELDWDNSSVVKNKIEKLIQDIKFYHPNANIVIEGVENLDRYNFLRDNIDSLDFLQGYLFWKPDEV